MPKTVEPSVERKKLHAEGLGDNGVPPPKSGKGQILYKKDVLAAQELAAEERRRRESAEAELAARVQGQKDHEERMRRGEPLGVTAAMMAKVLYQVAAADDGPVESMLRKWFDKDAKKYMEDLEARQREERERERLGGAVEELKADAGEELVGRVVGELLAKFGKGGGS